MKMSSEEAAIADAFKTVTSAQQSEEVLVQKMGGSEARFYRINKISNWFCKRLPVNKFPQLLRHEKDGLEALRAAHLPVPEESFIIDDNSCQHLFTTYHNGQPKKDYWEQAGTALARLHQFYGEQYGWPRNNYIGLIPQTNSLINDWSSFFSNYRLQPLVQQCADEGLLPLADACRFEKLYNRLNNFFEARTKPVLLHGDLWQGNLIVHNNGVPLFIDPSVYHGHPAMDVAMTHLFGGFAEGFYAGYKNAGGNLPSAETIAVCNLYPLLVHLKLFGASYLRQIQITILRFT